VDTSTTGYDPAADPSADNSGMGTDTTSMDPSVPADPNAPVDPSVPADPNMPADSTYPTPQ
jgi:hypothetical protein